MLIVLNCVHGYVAFLYELSCGLSSSGVLRSCTHQLILRLSIYCICISFIILLIHLIPTQSNTYAVKYNNKPSQTEILLARDSAKFIASVDVSDVTD